MVFEIETVIELIARYHIGTSKHWNGATVFWQITAKGEIRGGKVMLYDDETGKRVKVPFPHITWVHKILKDDTFILQQCFFGEHLLTLPENDGKPVCIVESEKTAIIASGFVPDVIWLATGGIKNLNLDRAKALGNRKVYLIPDLGAWDKWDQTVKKLNIYLPETHLILSDILQREASVPVGASDLADVLPLSPEKWIERIRQCILEGEKCTLNVVLTAENTPEKAIFAGETVLITPPETEKNVDSQKKDANKGETSILKSAESVVSNVKKGENEILPKAVVKETTEVTPMRKITFEETLNDNNAFLEWFAQPNDDDDGEPFLPEEYRPKRFEPTMENVKALFENYGANATPYVEPVFYSEVKHSAYDSLRKRYAKGKEQKFINERLRKLQKEHRQTDKRGNILKYMNFLEMCECFGLRDALKHVGFVVSLHQPERYPLYRTYLEAVNG